MRLFHYSAIKDQKWDSDILGLIAAIYKEAGKQELYLKQRPEELEKLHLIIKFMIKIKFQFTRNRNTSAESKSSCRHLT